MKLKHIATQLSGHGTALYTRPWAWVQTRLWSPVSNLLASYSLKSPNAINLPNLSVQTESNSKAYPANQTTVEPLTKQGRIIARAKASRTGSQRRKTAHQTRQPANRNQSSNKGHVVKMKWAQLHMNVSKFVQTLTVSQWIQVGLKSLGPVNQRRLVAYLLQQLEKVRVALTNLVQSCTRKIVAALTHMANRLKAIGLKLQDSVHLHLQRVLRLLNLSKTLAGKTKSEPSPRKKAAHAQTPTANQSKARGLKQQETVRQPQQRAQRQRSKGH